MGRRRRRVIRIVKKKLPTVFVCPRCGEEAVRVSIDKQTGRATVACAICQLKDEFDAHPQAQAIDVYSYFTDRFYGVKDPRAIIPRERVAPPSLQEEPEEEEEASDMEEPIRPSTEEPGPPSEPPFEEPHTIAETQPDVGSSTEEVMSGTEAEEARMTKEQKEEEEENPFGDILSSSEKDKKKTYSSHPIEQESSTSSSSQ